MPVPSWAHATFTVATSSSQAVPQIFIPTLANLSSPLTNHDRLVRVRVKEVTTTAPSFPVPVYGIVNNTNSGITFGSETAFVPENAQSDSTFMSKYKLYSSGTTTITGGTTVRNEYVNPRLTATLEWYELRGADTFTVWTPQTTSAVTLLIDLWIGE